MGDLVSADEPTEIFANSLRDGVRRLRRPWVDLLATGFLGAMSVAIGALCADMASGLLHGAGVSQDAAKVVGALFFPLGFFFLVQIKAELFTENFLVPVNCILDGLAAPRQLLRLWAGAIAGNVVGCIFVARLATVPSVLPQPVIRTFVHVTDEKVLVQPLPAVLISGLLGGFLITLMTLGVLRGGLGGWMALFASGFLINVGTLQHCIVNTVDIWLGIFAGAHVTPLGWLVRNFLPVAAANVAGGVTLATIPHYLQVFHTRREALQDVKEEVGTVGARRRL
jgi:formate-nitrite transporter family protein